MGGAKFLKGGDIPRRFAPWGAIFIGDSPRGGANILGISPPFWEGGRISWGGESPVTPALCTNPFSQLIKYYSLWVHVSSQLYLLDGYFIIPKYNELNHLHRAQININADKNVIHWFLFSFQTVISLYNIWLEVTIARKLLPHPQGMAPCAICWILDCL